MKTAYPSTRNPVTITLYANIPFDNTYNHHTIISRLFKYNTGNIYFGTTSQIACERFINRNNTSGQYVYPRWTMTDTYNFNYSNGLIGNVTLELTAEQTNANYMKLECGNDIYYYFITSITQVNLDTYNLTLELDVLMTYQDEFLEGMKDVPVFTARKHCHRYTDTGLVVHCADYKTGDDAFANVKPSILAGFNQLGIYNTQVKKINSIKWLYICADGLRLQSGTTTINYHDAVYTGRDIKHPLSIIAVPLNINQLIIKNNAESTTYSYNQYATKLLMDNLINNGSVHGTKISNFPPFTSCSSITLSNGVLTLVADGDFTAIGGSSDLLSFAMGDNEFVLQTPTSSSDTNLANILKNGAFLITNQKNIMYKTSAITYNAKLKNATAPTIYDERYTEPKLLFSPFTKYVISSKYSAEGYEFYPELLFSEYINTAITQDFEMYATSYIGDNNYFTKLVKKSYSVSGVTEYAYANYEYGKIGLAGSVNYTIPAGTNALDVFNATQAQSFYTSKQASGITSGLTMLAGSASLALGVGMLSNPATALAGGGMIIGGASALASGTASLANTIKSTNAKIEDLANTPDSINISGSNFILDDGITASSAYPYVLRYECNSVVKDNATDYFYSYGYQVARDCYFNTELYYQDVHHKIDNNLFGRTIFNYIQIQDDITNKINANIPLIVKQKLSSIFNKGITIWNFFGLQGLWSLLPTPTDNTNPDKWFMKHTLDNTEYKV